MCFEANHVAIRFNLEPLEETTTFPYLRHIVTLNNRDWEDLYINLWKAQRQWGDYRKSSR